MSHGHAPFVILPITLEREKVTKAKCLDWRGFSSTKARGFRVHSAAWIRRAALPFQPLVHASMCPRSSGWFPSIIHLSSVIKPRRAGNAAEPVKSGTDSRHRPLELGRSGGEL